MKSLNPKKELNLDRAKARNIGKKPYMRYRVDMVVFFKSKNPFNCMLGIPNGSSLTYLSLLLKPATRSGAPFTIF